jgi:WhiB family transcriptional regulator, redox-sensing transcriptional regulator
VGDQEGTATRHLTSEEYKLVSAMRRWANNAACKDSREPGFLAERTNNAKINHEIEAKAKAICEGCPVRLECLNHALRLPERGGIWGGLNEPERHQLHKRLGMVYPK